MPSSQTTVLDTPNQLAFFRLASLKTRVGLELRGLKCHGESAYSQAKRIYDLRGSKAKVYDQLCKMTEAAIAGKQGG